MCDILLPQLSHWGASYFMRDNRQLQATEKGTLFNAVSLPQASFSLGWQEAPYLNWCYSELWYQATATGFEMSYSASVGRIKVSIEFHPSFLIFPTCCTLLATLKDILQQMVNRLIKAVLFNPFHKSTWYHWLTLFGLPMQSYGNTTVIMFSGLFCWLCIKIKLL